MKEQAEVSVERGAMASGVRLPAWYVVVWTASVLVLIGRPVLERWLGSSWAGFIVLLGLLGVLAYEQVLRVTSGVKPSRRTMVSYPSARVPGILLLCVVVIPLVLAMFVEPVAPGWALALAVAGGAGSTFFVLRMTAGIRHDITTGRATAA